ncbi:thiol reductant ABC exporter subunit CydC [Virgibacillus dakarensis]|uniref:Thiol reductant ABC exporter subunit CydC n=1 Tax=Lentibacillus populi TaxID=1827502 RepID=A0A9W5U0T2_9BACI|nr:MULTISPECIES: thiol reductant ABC exporter subunit CydC [Bacillaceae]MBT2217024.1 thiol reductant ABC exporter subunit CydC [Virgibacillus dakarensis]MTW86912.1 thiol reductant ABC exporter subunit CydC [Virgibacillus dakarensis]GGB52444.1 thiol reductant ABC exporter subunit CydC [Lentibacillus populi]
MKDLAIVVKLMMAEKKDIFYSILFGFVAGIAAVGLFAASGYLISKAALAPPIYALIILTSTVKLLGFTKAISRYLERYFSHRATFTILSNLRIFFFEKLEPLAPGILQNYRSGDLLARIVGDVERLQNFFLRIFYPPIVLTIVFLSTILFTSFFSIYAALALLIGLIITVFVVPVLFAVRQAKIASRIREGRGELSTEVTEFLHGFRDLKIYQKLEEKERSLIHSSEAYIKEQEQEGINMMYSQSVNTFISLIVSWFILALGAYFVVEGELEGIFLAMLVMISLTVFEDASPMAVLPIYLQDCKRAATRLFSIVREEKVEEEIQEDLKQLEHHKAPSIELNDVTFRFPDEWRTAFQDVSLRLPAGSKTAIVGPSGSGKSTLLQLLLKIYKADQGNILFDGVSIGTIDQTSIWNVAKVVLQENHFFFGTVRDNLLLAKDNLTDEQMENALANVRLEHLSLADPIFEKGENLSGGEKQRLAIARVMLKGGRLWLLDEPTSSIDALTEQAIYERLFKQAKDDTLVLVSHRLTGLEKMDQIIVMEQGKIIESGTFAELIERKGYFYKMKEIEKGLL